MNKREKQLICDELTKTLDALKLWSFLFDDMPAVSDAIKSRRKALKALKTKIKNKAV